MGERVSDGVTEEGWMANWLLALHQPFFINDIRGSSLHPSGKYLSRPRSSGCGPYPDILWFHLRNDTNLGCPLRLALIPPAKSAIKGELGGLTSIKSFEWVTMMKSLAKGMPDWQWHGQIWKPVDDLESWEDVEEDGEKVRKVHFTTRIEAIHTGDGPNTLRLDGVDHKPTGKKVIFPLEWWTMSINFKIPPKVTKLTWVKALDLQGCSTGGYSMVPGILFALGKPIPPVPQVALPCLLSCTTTHVPRPLKSRIPSLFHPPPAPPNPRRVLPRKDEPDTSPGYGPNHPPLAVPRVPLSKLPSRRRRGPGGSKLVGNASGNLPSTETKGRRGKGGDEAPPGQTGV